MGGQIMKRAELLFERPDSLVARQPAEARGIQRDELRLLVSTASGHSHSQFYKLANFLKSGDILVINRSATLAASMPAKASFGRFTLNLSTDYGRGLWLAEPRWSSQKPGPLPLRSGDKITVADISGQLVMQFPGLDRLWFIQFEVSLEETISRVGEPIRYAYVNESFSLDNYQTIFAKIPGSAEMPSAAYPFTERVVDSLIKRAVQIVDITLHTGVSSLELEVDDVEKHPLYPEPFAIPTKTTEIVNSAIKEDRRIIAVGTTVVRALESAWDGEALQALSGFTRRYIYPAQGVNVVDGLITGLHDPVTSHLAMLYAIADQSLIRNAYTEAVKEGYLWHEFGDSHLILARE
jgi:S-adenosylmethionine:tRNA ribosyltransferase-isomerase